MLIYKGLKIEENNLVFELETEDNDYFVNIDVEGVNISIYSGKESEPYTTFVWTEVFDDYTGNPKFSIPLGSYSKDGLIIIEPRVANIDPDAPCWAQVVDTAAIYNKETLLNKGMEYLKTLGSTCNISREFIDFILKKRALDLSISTCNYGSAIKYWKMLTMTKGPTIKGCGCNGR